MNQITTRSMLNPAVAKVKVSGQAAIKATVKKPSVTASIPGSGMGGGNVGGPDSAVVGNLAAFDHSSGKHITDSGIPADEVIRSTGGTMEAPLHLVGGAVGDEAISFDEVEALLGTVVAPPPPDNSISLSQLQDMPSDSVIGRNDPGSGDPEYLSKQEVKNLVDLGFASFTGPTVTHTYALPNYDATLVDLANLLDWTVSQKFKAGSTHGGTTASGRIATFANDGVLTLLYGNNALSYNLIVANSGITAVGHGTGILFQIGTAASGLINSGYIANTAADTYADAATQDAQMGMGVAVNGALAQRVTMTVMGGTLTGAWNVTDAVTGSNLSGTNTGDQTITLTGDVTGSGTGIFAATIANNRVDFARMQDIATASFLGRNTAGSGDPEALSIATAKTMLGIAGTNTGDQTIALTGDVTGSGTGSFAATIANNAVTLAKMADMATASFLGRNTAAPGDPEVLPIATVKTMLGITGSGSAVFLPSGPTHAPGLVPDPGGTAGSTKFLREDATWGVPSGTGTGVANAYASVKAGAVTTNASGSDTLTVASSEGSIIPTVSGEPDILNLVVNIGTGTGAIMPKLGGQFVGEVSWQDGAVPSGQFGPRHDPAYGPWINFASGRDIFFDLAADKFYFDIGPAGPAFAIGAAETEILANSPITQNSVAQPTLPLHLATLGQVNLKAPLASPTFSGNVITDSGAIIVNRLGDTQPAEMYLRSDNGQNNLLIGTGGSTLWTEYLGNSTPESGGPTGSGGRDFAIARHNNSGTYLDVTLFINRLNGIVSMPLGATTLTPSLADDDTSVPTTEWVRDVIGSFGFVTGGPYQPTIPANTYQPYDLTLSGLAALTGADNAAGRLPFFDATDHFSTVPFGAFGKTFAEAPDVATAKGASYLNLAAVATSGSASDLVAGSLPNARLAAMPTLTVKGNKTGAAATPTDLTGADVNTILPVFGTAKGLVPGTPSSTLKYLRADGVWAAPTTRLSPFQYGAVGDGVVNDTAAVLAAMTALTTAGGGVLDVTGGFFALPSLVTWALTGGHYVIRADGPNIGGFVATAVGGGLKITSSGAQASMHLKDFTITPGAEGVTQLLELDWPSGGSTQDKNMIVLERVNFVPISQANNKFYAVGWCKLSGGARVIVERCTMSPGNDFNSINDWTAKTHSVGDWVTHGEFYRCTVARTAADPAPPSTGWVVETARGQKCGTFFDCSNTYQFRAYENRFGGHATYAFYKRDTQASEGFFMHNNWGISADYAIWIERDVREPGLFITHNHINSRVANAVIDGAKVGEITGNMNYANTVHEGSTWERLATGRVNIRTWNEHFLTGVAGEKVNITFSPAVSGDPAPTNGTYDVQNVFNANLFSIAFAAGVGKGNCNIVWTNREMIDWDMRDAEGVGIHDNGYRDADSRGRMHVRACPGGNVAPATWATGTSYVYGDIKRGLSTTYKCIVPHKAWGANISATVPNWITPQAYAVGNWAQSATASVAKKPYRCLVAHNATDYATFDAALLAGRWVLETETSLWKNVVSREINIHHEELGANSMIEPYYFGTYSDCCTMECPARIPFVDSAAYPADLCVNLGTNNIVLDKTLRAPIADATGGTTIDTQARTQLNLLLQRLRDQGIMT